MRTRLELVASYFEPQMENPGRANWTASILALLIFLNLLAVVLESIDRVNIKFATEFFLFECFSIFFFTLEYIGRIYSAPALLTTVRPLGKSRRLGYIWSFSGLIDLIAILPFLLQFLIPGIDLRVLRALRLLRLLKLNQYTSAIDDLIAAVVYERKALLAAVYLLIISLFLSSTAVYLVESTIQPNAFGSIPQAMWWSIITLTTVGYGDIVPISPIGKVISAITAVMGVASIALVTGILGAGFTKRMEYKKAALTEAITVALEDGHISKKEALELDSLRKELDLSKEQQVAILNILSSKKNENT
jgi:voltage-gated potassium channel